MSRIGKKPVVVPAGVVTFTSPVTAPAGTVAVMKPLALTAKDAGVEVPANRIFVAPMKLLPASTTLDPAAPWDGTNQLTTAFGRCSPLL